MLGLKSNHVNKRCRRLLSWNMYILYRIIKSHWAYGQNQTNPFACLTQLIRMVSFVFSVSFPRSTWLGDKMRQYNKRESLGLFLGFRCSSVICLCFILNITSTHPWCLISIDYNFPFIVFPEMFGLGLDFWRIDWTCYISQLRQMHIFSQGKKQGCLKYC